MKRIRFLFSMSLLGCAALFQPAFAQDATAPTPDPARSTGVSVFHKWCSDCHNTAEGPGSMALQRKYQGALPAILTQQTDLSPDYIKLVVQHGDLFMPSFRKTEISDADLALLAAYLAPSQDSTSSDQAAPNNASKSKRK